MSFNNVICLFVLHNHVSYLSLFENLLKLLLQQRVCHCAIKVVRRGHIIIHLYGIHLPTKHYGTYNNIFLLHLFAHHTQ